MDFPFLDQTCIITPGTLTADQITNEMHDTDTKLGESMETDEEALSAAPTQPEQQTVSEDGGAERRQLKEVPEQATRQLRKRVCELETRTGKDLGTNSVDNVTDNTTNRDRQLRKHYSDWTNAVVAPQHVQS
eukprot:2160181-Rhodomonas_salina.1